MPGEPVPTFIGWTGLGFGVILVYAAMKDRAVFGKTGIIGFALTHGRIPTLKDLPAKGGSGSKSKGGIIPPGIPGLPLPIPFAATPPKPIGTTSGTVIQA